MARDEKKFEWVSRSDRVIHLDYMTTYTVQGKYVKIGEVTGHHDSGFFAWLMCLEENQCHKFDHIFQAKKCVEDAAIAQIIQDEKRRKNQYAKFNNQDWVKAHNYHKGRIAARRESLLDVEF